MKKLIIITLITIGLTACQKEPTATFTSSTTNSTVGEIINFINTSKDANSYEWNFGDGIVSTESSPSHTYSAAGTYTVSLKVFSKNGKKSDEAIKSIIISNYVDTVPPVISLIGSTTEYVVLGSTYTDPGATAIDDLDGNLTSSIVTDNNVNANFKGTYTVTFTVSDAAGNTSTRTRTVIVVNSAEIYAGTYNVSDFANGNTNNYTDNITASSTVNNRILVNKFAFYSGGAIYMNITGYTAVNLPAQPVNCGSPAVARTFAGGGTINGTTISVTYTETTNGTTTSGVETYTKQ